MWLATRRCALAAISVFCRAFALFLAFLLFLGGTLLGIGEYGILLFPNSVVWLLPFIALFVGDYARSRSKVLFWAVILLYLLPAIAIIAQAIIVLAAHGSRNDTVVSGLSGDCTVPNALVLLGVTIVYAFLFPSTLVLFRLASRNRSNP